MQDKELVTIAATCYNHTSYLADFFESVLNQTYPNLELVIVDDCSQDDSINIIESYRDRCNKELSGGMTFIRHEINKGVCKTTNDALKAAKGFYIKEMSTDDLLLPDAIEKIMCYMKKFPERTMLISNAARVEDSYRYGNSFEYVPLMDTKKLNKCEDLFESLLFANCICAVGVFYTKKFFMQYGYYDENLEYEDLDKWLTVSKNEKIHFIDDILVLYRRSITSFGAFENCEDKKDEKLRFFRMYKGGRDTRLKHTCSVEEDLRNRVLESFYLRQLEKATLYRIADAIVCIKSDIKDSGVILSKKGRIQYFILNFGIVGVKFLRLFREIRRCFSLVI